MGESVLAWALLFCMGTQVSSQQCGGACQCPPVVPACSVGVPLIWDSCQCCQVCARQRGEACSDGNPCDTQKRLACDYSASFPGDPGECVNEKELGCEMNGVQYSEGQVFQPSCAIQCRCEGGGVTCVSLCPEDVRLPSPDCPHPQRRQIQGSCCQQWMCENMDNNIPQEANAASSMAWGVLPGPPLLPSSGCKEHSTEWSACSRSCGPGFSTRLTNQNAACYLERQTRLCTVRPCHLRPPRGPASRRRCQPSVRATVPLRLRHRRCVSTRVFQPLYCARCSDGRCCTPHHTGTVPVTFRCPNGSLLRLSVMTIKSCACHHHCPQAPTRRQPHRSPAYWG
ncbi:WNT1-inducible-signaling pathway protein 2 [Clupea harengus]|uniref:WNT1-inducible-signaling pathway protein 2 n=1 Tax=Clupea harengus TaxID=7950 RepID=A0A6P3W5J1_CLUHA|nr:WNT1-inducible-signaling pathway protein 2 [Clupea harengus]